jgi:superfamily I DNA and RNA helicase
VQGAAGSGKSLVGRAYVEQRAASGARVLMVCYNRPLAERLRASLGTLATVNTWYGFCHAFLESRGQPVDFSGADRGPAFWREIQDRVMAEPIPEGWRFDALVVDEGQDFEDEWVDIIRLFLKDDAAILWLEDGDQNLQGKPPVALEGFVTYRCRENYRSPESIARFIRRTLPVDFEPANPLPGLGVGIEPYDESIEQPRCAARVLQRLVGLGFHNDDIVILTCRGAQNSVFSELDTVGGVRLRRFTGAYDGGDQVMTQGELTFDSVNRYKGQEAAAVVLVDVDPRPERLAHDLSVLFCGMTRATVRLDLIARAGNPENARFFAAVDGGRTGT